MKRVGFIVNSRVPEPASLRRGMPPHALVAGWDDRNSPMSFMRFRWIAEALAGSDARVRYELYRPWRRYAAVVFLKSMGPSCLDLARRLRDRGTAVLFEANVDYYTRPEGNVRLDVMAPSPTQRADAIGMTEFADAVIGSSNHLAAVCRAFNPRTTWIPDNVDLKLCPEVAPADAMREGRLQVWWSGMAAKLFEFLAAEDAFTALADRIHLHLVTDDVNRAKNRWPLDVRERLERFLGRVPHTIHPFRDIPRLLQLYGAGGVIVSPRFLDVPYNLSHTEWKITLGMACRLPAIASPVPSYVEAATRGGEGAVSVCETPDDWRRSLEAFLANPRSLRAAGEAARGCVEAHYETGVVARRHADCVEEAIARPAA